MMAVIKKSRQREALLRILRSTDAHPNADAIYEEVRKEIPKISLGTVYRNLNLLLSTGEILRLDVGDGCDHFDGRATPHYHLKCDQCGRILDLRMPYRYPLDREAELEDGAVIRMHDLVFYGCCGECKKNNII